MDRLFEWVVKAALIAVVAPFLLCLTFQWVTAVLVAILPWLVGLAVVTGIVAGLSAGVVLRRRLPPREMGRFPTPDSYGEPVRRPKGRGREG